MCVIICLPKGLSFNEEWLKNATLNNPHGFGLVAKEGDKLEVYHRFNEKGNDPEEVLRQLERYKDSDMRYLHLRYATKGDKNRENTHPFTVFKRDDQRIEFMHNGYISKFTQSSDVGRSDTRQYAEDFLSPLIERWNSEKGIEDPFFFKIVNDHFHSTCRGLLIPAVGNPQFYGGWTKVKIDEKDIIVSNDDYFKVSQSYRMTEHYRPKTQNNVTPWKPEQSNENYYSQGYYTGQTYHNTPKKEEASSSPLALGTATKANAPKEHVPTGSAVESKTSTDTTPIVKEVVKINGKEVTNLKDIDVKKTGRFLAPDDLGQLLDLVGDVSDLDDEFISALAMLTEAELRMYCTAHPHGAARLIENLTAFSWTMLDSWEELIIDKDNATKRIAFLTELLKDEGLEISEKKIA